MESGSKFLSSISDQFNVVNSGQSGLPPSSGPKPVSTSSLNFPQPQQGTSSFGSTSTSQVQPGMSLFGAPTNQAASSQAQQTSNVFGTSSNQPTGGNLFTPQQNQQPTSNFFGLNTTQQTQAPATNGLFATLGQSQVHNQPQKLQGNSIFGNNTSSSMLSVDP